MSFIKLEFSHDNELMSASFQTDNNLTPPSSNVKIAMISGKVFLNCFYNHKPIALKDKQGQEFQIDIEEISNCFVNGEDETLYLIFDGYDNFLGRYNLCAVWECYYDEEEIYRRYRVVDICKIRKFEMLIAAEEDLDIDAQSVINYFDDKTISGSMILNCYKSIDDDDADDENEYDESGAVSPNFCPYPGMCSNYEDDPDMCDKCGGF